MILSYNLILSKCIKLGVFRHRPNKLKLIAELYLLGILSSIFSVNLGVHACDIPLRSLKEQEFPYQPKGWKTQNFLLFEMDRNIRRVLKNHDNEDRGFFRCNLLAHEEFNFVSPERWARRCDVLHGSLGNCMGMYVK